MVVGLQIFTSRAGDETGAPPLLDTANGEELMHVEPQVTIVLGNRHPLSPGTLHISTKKVIWLSDVDKNTGFAVDFLSIPLHAVSRDPESYPSPCIYAQIEAEDDESEDSDLEGNDITDVSKITEMRLIPSDPAQLDPIFDIFCECAELNPEPNEDEEEENNWIFGADQLDEGGETEWQLCEDPGNPIGYSNGNHDVAHAMLELRIDDQRFEDAEEMERGAQSGQR